MSHTSKNRSSGMTLLEVTLAVSLLAVVAIKVLNVLQSATDSSERDTAQTNVEAKAHQVLRQIAFAIMGSHPDSLIPDVNAPFTSTSMKYQVSLGIADGELVWSDPECIALEEDERRIYWTDRPAEVDARRLVWTKLVAPYLEGELPNNIDDNGNGLIDEKGLAFTINGSTVEMHLTLEQQLPDGTMYTKTVSKTVACRNLTGIWRETE